MRPYKILYAQTSYKILVSCTATIPVRTYLDDDDDDLWKEDSHRVSVLVDTIFRLLNLSDKYIVDGDENEG